MLEIVSSDVNSDGSHFLLISYRDISCMRSNWVASEAILACFFQVLTVRMLNLEVAGSCVSANARMNWVRYRSHATYSRQPRQVRKEATVTGSCVCSESPVPDLFFSTANLPRSANL